MGHWGHVPPLLQMAGHGGGTVSRRTANKKLTKLYWPSRKPSPKRLIVLLEPKRGGHDQKIFFSRRIGAPTFKFVPAPLCLIGNISIVQEYWTLRWELNSICVEVGVYFQNLDIVFLFSHCCSSSFVRNYVDRGASEDKNTVEISSSVKFHSRISDCKTVERIPCLAYFLYFRALPRCPALSALKTRSTLIFLYDSLIITAFVRYWKSHEKMWTLTWKLSRRWR